MEKAVCLSSTKEAGGADEEVDIELWVSFGFESGLAAVRCCRGVLEDDDEEEEDDDEEDE